MTKIIGYDKAYDKQLMKLDMTMFLTIAYNEDVIPGSLCLAADGDTLRGAGLLKASSTWYAMDRVDHCYVNFDFVTDEAEDADGTVTALILNELKARCARLCGEHQGRTLILRAWRESKDTKGAQRLIRWGFRPMRVIPVMARTLTDGDVSGAPSAGTLTDMPELRIAEIDPRDPEIMERYMVTNEEAFGVADSAAELRFTMGGADAHVYAVMKGDDVTASATTWKITDTKAATENIFCAEKYRRQGITSRLLAYAFGRLRENGYEEASLTVFGDNQPAMQMYLKNGYHLDRFMLEYHYQQEYKNTGY